MASELSRVQKLAWRVSWLDRHRSKLSIGCAMVVAIVAIGADWPQMLLCVALGFVVWAVLEVGLVWLTAIWETECAILIRERGLPRAVVRKG